MKKLTFGLIVCTILVSVVFAQQDVTPDKSPSLVDEREILFKERLMKAVSGDIDAQVYVAESYLRGQFPASKDEQMGLAWMEKAALAGNKSAATQLALWYLNKPNGRNHPELIVEWVKWFSISEGRLYISKDVSEATLARGHSRAQAVWDKHPGLRSQTRTSSLQVDERALKFSELLAKAESGDALSQYEVGIAYSSGRYPAEKDEKKGRDWIERAALAGHKVAAQDMAFWCLHQPNGRSDANLVAERVKWLSIQSGSLYKSSEISETTLAEGHRRADAIWKSYPNLLQRSPVVDKSSGSTSSFVTRLPVLPKVSNLSQFNDMRRSIVSAYLKASSPIYNKGELASSDERQAFVSAALELKSLQAYTKKKPLRLKSAGRNDAMSEINLSKMKECYDRMSFANIKAEFPCSRSEQNEASKYISSLNDLMSLPVDFGSSY